MPSGLWIETRVRYFGMTVDTMPTPMNSMARMQHRHEPVQQALERSEALAIPGHGFASVAVRG